jgi:hypothetical protein
LRKNVNFAKDLRLRKAFDPVELINPIKKMLKENDLEKLHKFLDEKKYL